MKFLEFHDFSPPVTHPRSDFKHRDGFAVGWERAGRLASREHADLLPGFNWNRHCPTVATGVIAPPFGLPPLIDFRCFRL